MTEIKLYNTKSRKKEAFEPIRAEDVRMYVCGPTVYDRAHIGNARPVIVFDMLYRLLRHVYGAEHVTYVRNFTDVDDKINAKAADTGRTIGEITEETIGWYLEDMAAVGALEPNAMPRATGYIAEMIAMIEALIEKGHAYAAEGHALFRVRSYENYGALSGRDVDDMIAGARVEVAPYKEDPMDFVLWKPSSEDQPGWESPWGRGRPGWHIECSAMAKALLGDTFDIHGGGLDLQFPHHEDEIAQSCCANDTSEMAKVWMHNEMLQVEGKKMSKSLGNFFTVRDLLTGHGGAIATEGNVIRYVFLSTHYRKPMDWTEEKANAADLKLLGFHGIINRWNEPIVPQAKEVSPEIIAALANDLNTHLALAHLDKVAKIAGDYQALGQGEAVQQLANDLDFLGLWNSKNLFGSSAWLDRSLPAAGQIELEVLAGRLHVVRDRAMQTKDFSEVDRLKAAFVEAGLEVRMSKEGVELVPSAGFDPAKLEGLL